MDKRRLWYIALGDLSKPFIAATIHCREDVRGLAQRGWDAILLSQSNTKEPAPDTTREIIICRNRPFYFRLIFELKVMWRLLTAKHKPAFVLFRGTVLLWIGLLLKGMNIPFGVELAGPPLCFIEGFKPWRLRHRSDLFFLKNADVIIVLNRELADIADRYRKSDAVVAITGVGVNAGDYQIVPNPNRDDPLITLGFLGTMYLNRGLGNIIDAVDLLRQKGLQTRLVVVGDGEARAAAEQKVRDLGLQDSVVFKGWVTPQEVGTALAECDLMIALYERTPEMVIGGINPMKVWTSLALGRPVLLFNPGKYYAYENVPGIFACPDTAPAVLAETILQIWRQHGKSGLAALGIQAREYVKNHVTWQNHADVIDDAIQRRFTMGK